MQKNDNLESPHQQQQPRRVGSYKNLPDISSSESPSVRLSPRPRNNEMNVANQQEANDSTTSSNYCSTRTREDSSSSSSEESEDSLVEEKEQQQQQQLLAISFNRRINVQPATVIVGLDQLEDPLSLLSNNANKKKCRNNSYTTRSISTISNSTMEDDEESFQFNTSIRSDLSLLGCADDDLDLPLQEEVLLRHVLHSSMPSMRSSFKEDFLGNSVRSLDVGSSNASPTTSTSIIRSLLVVKDDHLRTRPRAPAGAVGQAPPRRLLRSKSEHSRVSCSFERNAIQRTKSEKKSSTDMLQMVQQPARRATVAPSSLLLRGGVRPSSSEESSPPEKSSAACSSAAAAAAKIEFARTIKKNADMGFVKEQRLRDPHGDIGLYTGSISRFTGAPSGKGRLIFGNGGYYDGDWVHGIWSGFGRLLDNDDAAGDADEFEGDFMDDYKHGNGKMVFSDGRTFQGSYILGKMHEGNMLYPNGATYRGRFRRGKRNGRGVYTFQDGSTYKGAFRDDCINGHGQLTWLDGTQYTGDWSNGRPNGFGKERGPDGELRHEGLWHEGEIVVS